MTHRETVHRRPQDSVGIHIAPGLGQAFRAFLVSRPETGNSRTHPGPSLGGGAWIAPSLSKIGVCEDDFEVPWIKHRWLAEILLGFLDAPELARAFATNA